MQGTSSSYIMVMEAYQKLVTKPTIKETISVYQIETVKLAIVGSRNFTDYSVVEKAVDEYIQLIGQPSLIISGGAKGVDTLAEQYAEAHKISKLIFQANWAKYGKRAGPIRNKEIVNECTHVIAFVATDSVGTKDTITQAKLLGREVKVILI